MAGSLPRAYQKRGYMIHLPFDQSNHSGKISNEQEDLVSYSISVTLFMFLFGLNACSSGQLASNRQIGTIGDTLTADSALILPGQEVSEQYFAFDDTTDSIGVFELDPFRYSRRIKTNPLETDEKVTVFGLPNGEWVAELSTKRLRIHPKNGKSIENPLKFAGTPRSAAISPVLDYLVIYDDLQSVGMMKIAEDGQVEESAVLGPLLEEGKSIVSGDVNGSGELILSLSDNSIAVVDLEKTINQEEWVYVLKTPITEKLNWLSPAGDGVRIIGYSDTKIYLIDLDTGTVLEEHLIIGSVQAFRAGQPHLYDLSQDQSSLVSANDDTSGLDILNFGGSFALSVNRSRFVKDERSLLLQAESYEYKEGVYAFRTSDALIQYSYEIQDGKSVAIGSNFFLVNHHTKLGKVEKLFVDGDQNQEKVEGFNLDSIQKR